MYYNNKLLFVLICAMLTQCLVYSMNWLRPYDSLLQCYQDNDQCYRLRTLHEWGIKSATGYDCNGHGVNVLGIWNRDQNVITMLQGFDASSVIAQTYELLDATDDGIRGHLCPSAYLYMPYAGALDLSCYFEHGFSLHLYIPWMVMQLRNVCWKDLTQDNSEQDMRVKEIITDQLSKVIYQLGDGLDIGPWKRSGFGDSALVAQWMKDFIQHKALLKNVQLRGRAGLIIPSGKKKDEDKLFALPFGYDGALGILYGGGLQLNMGHYCKIGFDVELLHLFGNIRERRIKTDICQTELLLLAKTCAYKDYGLTQRFNLFTEFDEWFERWSFLIGYQYFKHGDDRLSLITQEYSNGIANSAVNLEEWTMHHVVFKVGYEYTTLSDKNWHTACYFRIPVKGERTALIPVVGIQLAVAF